MPIYSIVEEVTVRRWTVVVAASEEDALEKRLAGITDNVITVGQEEQDSSLHGILPILEGKENQLHKVIERIVGTRYVTVLGKTKEIAFQNFRSKNDNIVGSVETTETEIFNGIDRIKI